MFLILLALFAAPFVVGHLAWKSEQGNTNCEGRRSFEMFEKTCAICGEKIHRDEERVEDYTLGVVCMGGNPYTYFHKRCKEKGTVNTVFGTELWENEQRKLAKNTIKTEETEYKGSWMEVDKIG